MRHASERELSLCAIVPRGPGRSHIERAIACHCFSSSSASQAQQSATDQGVVASGSTVAHEKSLAVGQNARYSEAGSVQAGANANIGNVTLGTGAVLTAGFGADTLGGLVDKITNATSDQISHFTETIADQSKTLETIAKEAATNETEKKSLTWIAGGAVAALALVFFAKRS